MKQLWVIVAFLLAGRGFGLSLEVGSMAGIMVQPNSQYFHLAGGAYAGLDFSQGAFVSRVYYLQRPEHDSLGIRDKESGLFFTVGQKPWHYGPFALLLWLGRGKVNGYLEETSSGVRREYTIWGYAAGMELAWKAGFLDLALCHISFAGLDGENQIRAYVAWPFSFFTLNLGVSI